MNDLQGPVVQIAERPDVDVRAGATRPHIPEAAPPILRRRSVILGVAIAALVAGLAGGAVWWQRTVTGDPGLEFYGGPNIYRDAASTDRSGIEEKHNMLGDEVDIDFTANGRLHAHFGLYNGGRHDVRIEGAPASRDYYWGFDSLAVSADPDDGFVGVASRYEPFRPFTLRPGETREVRLDFRLADCDPASLQPAATAPAAESLSDTGSSASPARRTSRSGTASSPFTPWAAANARSSMTAQSHHEPPAPVGPAPMSGQQIGR